MRPRGAGLGSAAFRMAVAPSIVPVRLSAPARRLARCAGRIRVSAAVADRAGAAPPVEVLLRVR
jgi:hypothetical protein